VAHNQIHQGECKIVFLYGAAVIMLVEMRLLSKLLPLMLKMLLSLLLLMLLSLELISISLRQYQRFTMLAAPVLVRSSKLSKHWGRSGTQMGDRTDVMHGHSHDAK
jgi:hypothetical protein